MHGSGVGSSGGGYAGVGGGGGDSVGGGRMVLEVEEIVVVGVEV